MINQIKKTTSDSNSSLNILYIISVLKQYSSKDNPLSIQDIENKLSKMKEIDSDAGISISTCKRLLSNISSKAMLLNDLGFSIKSTENNITNKKTPIKYYYEGAITQTEIQLLIQSIKVSTCISAEDIANLINKLKSLNSNNNSRVMKNDFLPNTKIKDVQLFDNFKTFDYIISNRYYAKVEYGSFGTDKNLHINKGYPKKIAPIAITANNGFYYVVAYNGENWEFPNHYRLDRFMKIEISTHKHIIYNKNNIPKIEYIKEKTTEFFSKDIKKYIDQNEYTNFNSIYYKSKHPIMYGGNPKFCKLLCNKKILNNIFDYFGFDIKICDSTYKDTIKYIEKYLQKNTINSKINNEEWVTISFESAPSGVELFATQYCNNCIIIEPISSYENVKNILQNGLNLYKSS